MSRLAVLCCMLLTLTGTSAIAQVQVDVRLEKAHYLAGEPVVVLVDVRNVGEEAIGYSTCDGDVRLAVAGAQRRVPPNIFGCFAGIGHGGGCGIDHPPLLQPGQVTTFWYLLKEYDLRPGQYTLSAAGKAGVRWKYYSVPTPNAPPPPPPKHKETDPVPGAQFDGTLSLNVAPSSERELRTAFASVVSDADATDPVRRYNARAAIIESAPPFLEPLIARFAAEDQFSGSAIDALGRIASKGSRTHLKSLFSTGREQQRATIVLALAGIGHSDDAAFFAGVLADETTDAMSKRYAALGLGRTGSTQAVHRLERALVNAPADVRPSIAIALGNTRSRAAVPVLIQMFGNNPSRNDVCGALRMLTHRAWCDGTADDPAATRRQWLRWWNEKGSRTSIFGSDKCPADPVAPQIVPAPILAVQESAPSGPPRISRLSPRTAAPGSILSVSGYALGLEDPKSVHVLFTQDSVERKAIIGGAGRTLSRDPDSSVQYMDVVVPAELTPGRWHLVIDANGRRGIPVSVEITEGQRIELTRISPPQPHPAQLVTLSTKGPAHVADFVQLTDARGTHWRIPTGASSFGISLTLPDDIADGEASIRVEQNENGVERFSEALRFVVTSGPLPLSTVAVGQMTPVAPGQWTDIVKDYEIEFEVRRVDRIDVEFQQGDVSEISRATGPDNVHVRVPARLKPGAVSVRTRTWIERTASPWSVPTTFTLLERAVPPTITAIEAGPFRNLVWWSGDSAPTVVETRRGDSLVLRGHFPVVNARALHVQVRGSRGSLGLEATDVDGGVRVEIPARASSGDWRLVVGTRDGRTAPHEITTIRVN